MAAYVEIGEPPIVVRVKRSARAHRISLRISGTGGGVSLTLPEHAGLVEAVAFARLKERWLRQHLDARPDAVQVDIGVEVPVEGRMIRIASGGGRRYPVRTEDTLEVPLRGAPGRVKAYLRTLARDRLTAASDRYASALGKGFCKITLRDPRSRWGSCTSDGALMYSWRLVMAPPKVLAYVAAHEIAHLVEMNHSSAFWAVVEHLCPGHVVPRTWLKREGFALHRYRF
ncbi:MAG: M48 family metallopeptidase [Rhodobacteraceae bacterium]|nr:M48 family metallopeptidase [Paracoccaceae bacterium]